MSVTLDSTTGGTASNTYCSLEDADAYHADHLYASVWNAANSDQKAQGLIMATRLLDALVLWKGVVTDRTQRLLWPRYGTYGRNEWLLSNLEIPQEIKDATAEYARQLIASDRTADSTVELQGLTSLTVGSVAMAFKASTITKVMPDGVFYLIQHLGTLLARGAGFAQLSRV